MGYGLSGPAYTHQLPSSSRLGGGQSWHGGVHPSPGSSAFQASPGVGCLFPRPTEEMAYGGGVPGFTGPQTFGNSGLSPYTPPAPSRLVVPPTFSSGVTSSLGQGLYGGTPLPSYSNAGFSPYTPPVQLRLSVPPVVSAGVTPSLGQRVYGGDTLLSSRIPACAGQVGPPIFSSGGPTLAHSHYGLGGFTGSSLPPLPISSVPSSRDLVVTPGRPVSPTYDEDDTRSCASATSTATSDLSSLPALLASLESVDPSLVAVKEQHSGILTDAEALSRATRPVARELLVSESPLLASFLSAASTEVRGFEASTSLVQDPMVLGPKPLRSGQYLKLNKVKAKPFSKPSPPLAYSALPPRVLNIQETERAILSSHDGKSSPSLSATIPDGVLADWEESHRLSLECSSLLERFIDVLFKDTKGALPEGASLTDEQRSALLLASAKCVKANMQVQSRSFVNTILARRDALLSKAMSRVPASEKDILRALPLDPSGLLGPKALLSPSLRPLSESNAVLMELAKALKGRNQPSNKQHKPSPAKKRSFAESAKEKAGGNKTAKKPRFSGKAKQGANPKPSPAKSAVSPP